jgi:hypothetical protein
LIHARNYSDELKAEIKAFKSQYSIPYFQLWKGFLIVTAAILIWAVIYGVKNKLGNQQREKEVAQMVDNLKQLKAGQLYGATFFTDQDGNSINGLPAGWIKIDKIVGDTIFIHRSKQLDTNSALFDMKNIASFRPQSTDEWQEKTEKMDLNLLKNSSRMLRQKSRSALYR